MSLSEQEREAFERLLATGSAAVRKLGQEMHMIDVLALSMPYTQAANVAERILDPLRTTAERRRAEDSIR